jgi:ATP-dependent DNA helicase RecG
MEFRKAGLPAPLFSVQHGEFKVVFKNNIFPLKDAAAGKGSLTDAILEFCAEPRSRSELIAFTGKSRYHTMSNLVQPLIETGKLRQVREDLGWTRVRSPSQRYTKVHQCPHAHFAADMKFAFL